MGVAAYLVFRSQSESADDSGGGGGGAGAPDDRELEALARVIQSEAGGEPWPIQVAVAWATKNEARREGRSILALVTRPTGGWSHQGGAGGNYYCTTAVAPGSAATELARQIQAGELPDPTHGAVQYDSPKAQRDAARRGLKRYLHADGTPITPEEVAEDRRRDGKELVLLPGIPEERFRMWRRA
ncbi:MAG TPA: hypothetical protein VN646_16855 [Candidatus Acidoferrum sp.]|nr:hypothetical protein [Candidatus Acidoferrum sp.]